MNAKERYFAYHVDLQGVAQAVYPLEATDDKAAREEGQQYLSEHPTIEVWHGPRWVSRFVREN